ncbi:hypothetical protein [Haliscomenobacter sp.]|uniref:hypothetical protein n=1 Tax=Haliscomenobacter sp. TaxID=2717303 RepID=UPI003364D9B1
MNVRLQYDLDFLAGVYYEDQLQMNRYTVSLNLLTKSKDSASTNIALDRAKAFVHGALESTVFINQANVERAEFMQMIGINVTTLPQEPVDQIVGMMLYYKLNSVMEDRMTVTGLDIASSLGDNVWYQHDEEDLSGPFAEDGWWYRASMQHESIERDPEPGNIVKVMSTGWYELDLEWPENTAIVSDNTVVYANFPRNEK